MSRMILHRCKRLILQTLHNPLNLQKTHYDSLRLFVLSYSSSIHEESSNPTDEISNLLRMHNFSPTNASKVASSLPCSKNAQNCDSVLTFLKDAGFSPAQLEKMVLRRPNLLTSDLDSNIKPKIQVFHDFGFSSRDIAVIFSAHPDIFGQSLTKSTGIVPSIFTLKTVLGSIDNVSKVLKLYAPILDYDLENTLLPNVDYLKSCGIGTDQIATFAHSFPRLLVLRLDKMKKIVAKAEEMGCARQSKMFIYGVRAIASMSEEALKQKLDLFREVGFSDEEILLTFEKRPYAIAVSCRKICKAVKLINDSKIYSISDIIRYPEMLVHGMEKTIEPRLRVLYILETRNLLKKPPAFSATYAQSNQYFFDRFIAPYLGEVDEFRSLDGWSKEFSLLDSVRS